MVSGEGMGTILIFIGALVLIILLLIGWQLLKRRQSVYTYAYNQRKA